MLMALNIHRRSNLSGDVKNQQLVSAALDEALDILGQASKKALLFHLHTHSISLYNPGGGASPFTLEQLHSALQTTLGPGGAELITDYVLLKMDELSSKPAR